MSAPFVDFVDPPVDPFDTSRIPGSSPLPIDLDVFAALADPNVGLATTPKASDRAQSAVDGLAGAVTQGLSGTVGSVSDMVGQLATTQTKAQSARADTTSIAQRMYNAWFRNSAGTGDAGQVTDVINAIYQAVYQMVTVYTLVGSGNFVVPQCSSLIIVPTNGGGGGQAGILGGAGGVGGLNGGWQSTKLTPADLGGVGAVIPYVAGLAGAGGTSSGQQGGVGGVSRFGPEEAPYIVGVSGQGNLPAEGGFVPTTSTPGDGGRGGGQNGSGISSGGKSALVMGGLGGGFRVAGGAGKDSPGGLVPSGGSGGGGGGYNQGVSSPGREGGAGGKYGGAGGGGGSCTDQLGSSPGPGGNGASGAIIIIAA